MNYLYYFFFFFLFCAFLWSPVVARDCGCCCVRSGVVVSSLSSSVLSEVSPMTSSKVTRRFRLFCVCVCLLKNVAMRIFCLYSSRTRVLCTQEKNEGGCNEGKEAENSCPGFSPTATGLSTAIFLFLCILKALMSAENAPVFGMLVRLQVNQHGPVGGLGVALGLFWARGTNRRGHISLYRPLQHLSRPAGGPPIYLTLGSCARRSLT